MISPFKHFFSRDSKCVEQALRALCSGAEGLPVVARADLPLDADMAVSPQSLWSESIFGPRGARNAEAWALIALAVPVLHPLSFGPIAQRLGLSEAEIRAVAEERAWLEGEGPKVCFPPGHPGAHAPLSTRLWDWPPDPGYATEELWRTAIQAPAEMDYEAWLEGWYRERGIDPEAVAPLRKNYSPAFQDQAEGHTGVDAILQALSEKVGAKEAKVWGVLAFPVPPVNERPMEKRPGGFWVGGAKSDAIADILFRNERVKRLMELEAPRIFVRIERMALMEEVKRAIALCSGEKPEISEPYEGELRCEAPSLDTPFWPIPEEVEALFEVKGLAFTRPGRAYIDFATTTFEVDLETGALLSTFRSGGLRLVGFREGLGVYSGQVSWSFFCFQAAESKFLDGPLPPVLPFVFQEHHEVASVVDVATRRTIRLKAVGDYPTNLLLSPCLRYLSATDKHGEGGVFRYDGELQFPFGFREPAKLSVLGPKGMKDLSDSMRERFEEKLEQSSELLAFVLDEKRDIWRRFEGNGVVEGRELRFRLMKPVVAAAFDETGEFLLAATKNSLMLIEGLGRNTGDIRLKAHYDLRPLHPLLAGPSGAGRPRAEALNAVLYHYGTLAAAAGASIEELERLNMASTYDEPVLIGRDKAKGLLDWAKKAKTVEILPRL